MKKLILLILLCSGLSYANPPSWMSKDNPKYEDYDKFMTGMSSYLGASKAAMEYWDHKNPQAAYRFEIAARSYQRYIDRYDKICKEWENEERFRKFLEQEIKYQEDQLNNDICDMADNHCNVF